MDEPMLRVWMQESVPPAPWMDEVPGRWVAEDEWPSPRVEPRRLRLDADGVLRDAAGEARPDAEAAAAHGADGGRLSIRGAQLCGADAGAWCAESQPSDFAPDQRAAEGQSLCFTSAPLAEPLEILGHPRLTLRFASDRPLALVAARLDDVGAGRRLQARHDAGLQPDAPDEPREAEAPRAGPGVRGDDRARRDRPVVPGRPPAAPRALADLLAVGLALAGSGHAHGGRRRELPRAAGAAGAARGRGPPAVRPADRPGRSRRRPPSAAAAAAAPIPATSPPTTSSGPSDTWTAATSCSPMAGRAKSGTG